MVNPPPGPLPEGEHSGKIFRQGKVLSQSSLGGPSTGNFPSFFSPGSNLAFNRLALAGLCLGTAGLIISLRLLPRLWQSLASLFSLNFENPASRATPLDGLKGPYPFFPLLALLLWLTGAGALLLLRRETPKAPLTSLPGGNKTAFWLGLGGLLFLALLAGWLQRSNQLLPGRDGLFPQPNYDEMVYYSGSALFADGHPPYREFFTAHPPVVYLFFAAIFKLLGLESGGADAFFAGRFLSVLQGLLVTGGVFWAAGRLYTGSTRRLVLPAAFAGALFYALDGRASEIAVLEVLSNLFAIGSFIALLEAKLEAKKGNINTRLSNRLALIAGGLAAAAALAKIPGLALFFAILVYLTLEKDWRTLVRVLAGFLVTGLVIELPFVLLVGPGEVLRQQFFFQLLRPQEVRAGLDQVSRIADYPEASLTLFAAGIGLVLLSFRLARKGLSFDKLWLIPVLWSLPLILIFSAGKSYHNWYYVQWALPLALLGAAPFAFTRAGKVAPAIPANGPLRASPGRNWRNPALKGLIVPAVFCLVALPFLLQEWQSERKVEYDRVYQPARDFIRSQPSPAGELYALDPGYSLLAGLRPAQMPNNKYIIDGSGYLVYLNLELDRKGLLGLTGDFLKQDRSENRLKESLQSERGQSQLLQALHSGAWAALDGKIALPQLTPRSVEYIQGVSLPGKAVDYVTLYRVAARAPALSEKRFDNGLWLDFYGLSFSREGQANFRLPDPDGILRLSSSETGQLALDLRFIWRVEQNPPQQLKVFVHLINEQGQIIAQRDLPPLAENTDTRNWKPGDAFQDVQSLPFPPGLAPGRIKVIAGIYTAATGARVNLQGQDNLTLGYIEIK